MKLPNVQDRTIREAFRIIEAEDLKSEKTDRNIVIGSGRSLVLTSPNGTQYKIVVDNAGNLSAVAV